MFVTTNTVVNTSKIQIIPHVTSRSAMQMDECQEISECENGIQIIDASIISGIFNCDESLNDEIDLFNMTSLSTLVFLSQRDNDETESYCDEDDKRLTLAYEKIEIFPKTLLDQFSSTIQILDISHNEFENLDFLSEFKVLTTLICDHNNINSNTVIPHMAGLQILWLNFCKIDELYPWARYLKESCPKIKYLSLMGNLAAPSYLNGGTFYEYLQYRLFMISLFPTLEHLDDRQVTEEQQKEAYRLYRRPMIERITSKSQILPTYIRTKFDKITNIFQPTTPFTLQNKKNIIV